MKQEKRKPISKKIRSLVLNVSAISMFLIVAVTLFLMMRMRNGFQSILQSYLENNIVEQIGNTVKIANSEFSKYVNYIRESSDYITDLYENPDKYKLREVGKIDKTVVDSYSLQRNFNDFDVDVDQYLDELYLLANIESLWKPLLAHNESIIASIYLGTESGFSLSYDKYAYVAELNSKGEGHFKHLSRPWYVTAKEKNETIFTNVYQDDYGRGATVTCATPFYENGVIKGVVAMDILISDTQKELIAFNMGESSYSFIVDEKGYVVASPEIDKYETNYQNINDINCEYYPIRNQIQSGIEGIEKIGDAYYVYIPSKIINWVVCAKIPQKNVMALVGVVTRYIYNMLIIFAIVAIILLIIILYVSESFSRNISEPINMLAKDVSIISDGNLDRHAKIVGNDEIGDLAKAFNNMTSSLKKYIQDFTKLAVERERIGAELDVATHIQSSMLPNSIDAFPDDHRFEIFATMDPAKEVGGDFYDFFMVDDKHLAFVVADVSGKGVPAALFMAIGKTLIKDHTFIENNLADVFDGTNKALCESNKEGLFITAFEAVINLETGHMRYVNAGHEMPFLCRNGKTFEVLKIKPGFVLAGMETVKYSTGELTLQHGDTIFQYTDGVTEATNINDELFGMDRLKESLNKNTDKSMEILLREVRSDIDKFVGTAPQFDDITMLGFKFISK